MIEIVRDLPTWVHIVVIAITIAISGFVCVDEKGEVDADKVFGCAVITLFVAFLWQAILMAFCILGILCIPFFIGMKIKKMYLSDKKRKEEWNYLKEIFPKQEDNSKTIEKYKKV